MAPLGQLSLLAGWACSPPGLFRGSQAPQEELLKTDWGLLHSELFGWSLRECVTLTNPKQAAQEDAHWLARRGAAGKAVWQARL